MPGCVPRWGSRGILPELDVATDGGIWLGWARPVPQTQLLQRLPLRAGPARHPTYPAAHSPLPPSILCHLGGFLKSSSRAA